MRMDCDEAVLLRAEAPRFTDDAAPERLEFAVAANRVLAPPRGASFRYLDDDLAALCSSLSASLADEHQVSVTLTADPVLMTARRSWQVSLIVWELMSEAAKHATSTRDEGAIDVSARVIAGILLIAVLCDGPADRAAVAGRGRITAAALASDLGGVIVRRQMERGFCAVLSVPVAGQRAV